MRINFDQECIRTGPTWTGKPLGAQSHGEMLPRARIHESSTEGGGRRGKMMVEEGDDEEERGEGEKKLRGSHENKMSVCFCRACHGWCLEV